MAHPLQTDQGDVPNPIASPGADGVVTFDHPGIFGFRCQFHLEMRGAVQVVAAPPVAVSAGGAGALSALGGMLLVAGVALTRSRRRRP